MMSRKIFAILHKRLWSHLQAQGFQHHIGRSYYRLADGQVWYAASRALNAHLQHIGRPSADSAFDCVAGIYHFDADEQAIVERYLQVREPYWGTQYLMSVQCDGAPSQTGGGRKKDMSLWRVAAEGGNLDAVMDDFEAALVQQALPFWVRMSSDANAAAARRYNAEKRAQAQEFREGYFDAVDSGKAKEAEECLRYWLLRDAPDYVAYWGAHGGDPLRKIQGSTP
ncbi:hypothetical protein [Neisseria shayeganii]|uniref:Uncharacterized protein n=1 Tax=Neisseria shayeganii 871 TaxID=1032488 RepID=G4CGJ2_9NEIS|nr:hypothetical protein [Neisseria shayeganii]EGY53043.1 hypothetical protein HMPREF9371_0731 [Neisseria shayeganii 871]